MDAARTPRTPPPWYREITPRKRKSFFAAWIGYLLDGFDFVLITLVLTEIADDFALSTVESASLVSGAFITRWLGGALLGALGDRLGRKSAMVASILLYSVGTFACGFAWDYTSLFTARLLIGMGMAGEYSASATYVLESWPARLRNRASGFLISGFSLGGVLAAEVYEHVVPGHGWRWLFYIGLLPVAVALWVRRALPEADDWQERVGSADVRPNPFRPLFAGRRRAVGNTVLAVAATGALFAVFTPLGAGAVPALSVAAAACLAAFAVQLGGRRRWLLLLALCVTVFCAFLYSWPVQALLPTYLKTELGYTPQQVSDALYFAGFGTMAGCVAAGFLGDRFGTRRAYGCTLLVGVAFVFPVFAVRDSPVGLGVLLFLMLACTQGISGLLPKYIAGHFPTEHRAASLGFTYNVGALGGAVAPVLGARLASTMSLGRSLAVLTFALTLVVILLIGFDVPRRLNRLIDPVPVPDHLLAEAVPRTDTAPGPERAGEPERPGCPPVT
ncbi:sialate:H+ symport family MFS transporter [Streptomyces daghestanicus]|uniref:Sialic acid transporter n=1 Tax=Streptomyces daghestanicus TaxID=66885 RepID=A0ABQ3PYH1_9ACTN|nr:sialate:H+ symport family MFS transporter [Streptomyces daghestanicus]GGU59038.1 putative sialic acid transporter [Streptomyces daghestanicus]GHI30065.1 putative sialic acid transporter [Streptomyces daghestanicus]